MTVLSSPDYRTVTSFSSVSNRSDRTVISAYVFGAKIGQMAVFLLLLQKRHMESLNFFSTSGKCDYLHAEEKKRDATQF